MWQKAYIPGNTPDGTPIFSVLAKKTYSISLGKVTPADEQVPLVESDTFENPDQFMYSEIVAETDYIAYKPTTDVVVTGKAYAPSGKQAYHLDCSVSAGPLKKSVIVYGPRKLEARALRGFTISSPQPFTEMELGYKHAYGGVARTKDGTLHSYFPNPIGKGFVFKGGFDDPEEVVIPHLEDPLSAITADNLILSKPEEWIHAPRPASFGWTRRNFYPRYTYAGVLPEQLQAVMEQYKSQGSSEQIEIPRLDYKVFQGASDGLWGEQLRGDEIVKLAYFDKDNPVFEFPLPGERPEMTMDLGEGPEELKPVLQTLTIDMQKKVMTMVWRGHTVYGGIEQLATLKKLEYTVS